VKRELKDFVMVAFVVTEAFAGFRSVGWEWDGGAFHGGSIAKKNIPHGMFFFAICFLFNILQGQVAKYNYSLRENSTKHFLPDLALRRIGKAAPCAAVREGQKKLYASSSISSILTGSVHLVAIFVSLRHKIAGKVGKGCPRTW
jgi:hypothetical protein